MEAGEVWEGRDEKTLVRVEGVSENGLWVSYRKCDGQGNLLPRTLTAHTSLRSFERRFVTLIYSTIKSPPMQKWPGSIGA